MQKYLAPFSSQRAELRKKTNALLPVHASEQEFSKAAPFATLKLICILEREGDIDGARNSLDYKAHIMAETINSIRATEFTMNITCSEKYCDKAVS